MCKHANKSLSNHGNEEHQSMLKAHQSPSSPSHKERACPRGDGTGGSKVPLAGPASVVPESCKMLARKETNKCMNDFTSELCV